MVDALVRRLDETDELENTFIFYSSDNGCHISQHRMHPGKECGFETDINVPLIVRGPGIPAGSVQRGPRSHTDLGPTVMKLAENPLGNHKFDGAPLDIYNEFPLRSEHAGVKFWGLGVSEGKYGYSDK